MGIPRVQYRERQRLLATDLRAEQDSRLGGMGVHLITHHQWGVVRGLGLVHTDDGWVLEAGIAVDGYGREIIVPEAGLLADEDTPGCLTVLLYYCEGPPARDCQPRPPDRMAGDYRIVLVDPGPGDPDEWLDLSRARAAGPMPDLPAWPVTLGRIGTCDVPDEEGNPLPDLSIARYTRARAGDLRSPSGRATLQLGLQSATDLYHLLLSTADSPTLSKRLGINRDGTVHVWRPLVLTGPDAVASATSASGVKFTLATVMSAGIGRVFSMEGKLIKAGAKPSISLVLHDSALARPVMHEHVFAASIRRQAVVAVPGVATLALKVTGERAILRPFLVRPAARARVKPEVEAALTTAPFTATFTPAGGHFKVERAEVQAEQEELGCADISRTHSTPAPAEEGIVVVKPAVEATLDPATRCFHALESEPPGQAPSTELRLLGGAFDKTDASSRIAFGGRFAAPADWDPVFTMDGVGRFAIPGSSADLRLRVEQGTLYVPPVSATPSDPLFQDLQALAFLGGLRAIGRVDRALTVTVVDTNGNATTQITDGDPLNYTLAFAPALIVGITVKRTFELLVGAGIGEPADLIVRSYTGSTPPTGASRMVVKHRANKVKLVVLCWLTDGQKDWVTDPGAKVVDLLHP